jgi:hypothetical protein
MLSPLHLCYGFVLFEFGMVQSNFKGFQYKYELLTVQGLKGNVQATLTLYWWQRHSSWFSAKLYFFKIITKSSERTGISHFVAHIKINSKVYVLKFCVNCYNHRTLSLNTFIHLCSIMYFFFTDFFSNPRILVKQCLLNSYNN